MSRVMVAWPVAANIDQRGFEWVIAHRVGILNPFFVAATIVGTAGVVWLALALVLAWRTRRPVAPAAVLTASCVWGADAITTLIKLTVARPRPFVALHHIHVLTSRPTSTSFPSGHATTATAGACILCSLWPRGAPAFVALAAAIAFSRVYVGVHYPGDVLGGIAVGITFAGAAVVAARRVERSRPTLFGRVLPR